MAIEKLKTDYQDDQPVGERKYEITQNDDGTFAIKDVTVYVKTGDWFGAPDINATNAAVNGIAESTSNINNTPDVEKRVAYAETAGTAATAQNATKAVNADHASTANSVENEFILKNKATLSFNNNNVCTIADTRITEDSLADVYFTSDTESAAERAVVKVDTYAGKVELTAGRTPEMALRATIRIRTV